MISRYASKPDASRAGIVAALKKIGASYVDLQGRKGTPDMAVGFRGRMWLVEIKAPGKESGVCGCDHSDAESCMPCMPVGVAICSGHKESVKAPNHERKTWHAQLAFRESWKGPPVVVWTTPEQAIECITRET